MIQLFIITVRVIVSATFPSCARPSRSTKGTSKLLVGKLLDVTLLCASVSPQPDPEDFSEEQWLMAKMVHLLKAEAADQQYVVGII